MIEVTLPGKNGRTIYLNPHLIEYIEAVDKRGAALLLTDGKRLLVNESPQALCSLVIAYRRKIGLAAQEE